MSQMSHVPNQIRESNSFLLVRPHTRHHRYKCPVSHVPIAVTHKSQLGVDVKGST